MDDNCCLKIKVRYPDLETRTRYTDDATGFQIGSPARFVGC
jgi:hypothetical protein